MPNPCPLSYRSAGMTHPGRVRTINQDAYLALPERGVWLVADGVGGHQQGDLASHLIVESLQDPPCTRDLRRLIESVEQRIQSVNQRLVAMSASSNPNTVIASTVAALIAVGSECVSLWAGDSRIYGLRQGRLSRLTRDHSFVDALVEEGQITPEQAKTHPEANVIYRAVGKDADLVLEMRLYDVHAGDRFLLCTDGLTKEATDQEITERLSRGDCTEAARALLDLALAAGARDNIAVIVVDADAPLEKDVTDDTAPTEILTQTQIVIG